MDNNTSQNELLKVVAVFRLGLYDTAADEIRLAAFDYLQSDIEYEYEFSDGQWSITAESYGFVLDVVHRARVEIREALGNPDHPVTLERAYAY